MDLDDPLYYGQTCSSAFGRPAYLIEQLKNLVVLAGIYSDTVISNKENG
jgi:hypothetical protein